MPAVGDRLHLSFYSSSGFQLATVPLRGIIAYPVSNETLDSIVLMDAPTMRSLLGMPLFAEQGAAAQGGAQADAGATGLTPGTVDSLFAGASDVKAKPGAGLKLSEVTALLGAASPADTAPPSSAWNYLLLRLKRPGQAPGLAPL